MKTDRVAIDTRGGVTPGPWEQPVRSALPVPQTDPRLELSEQALVVASQNAYPVVATQKSRRDNLGLAAGAAIALVLGCATFVSLSSSRGSLQKYFAGGLYPAPRSWHRRRRFFRYRHQTCD